MTKFEALFDYLQEMCGIQINEKEFEHIRGIFQKDDTSERAVPTRYLEDCIALRQALRDAGYDMGLSNAFSAWSDYSDRRGNGWLGMSYDENMVLDAKEMIDSLNRWGELDRDYFKIKGYDTVSHTDNSEAVPG